MKQIILDITHPMVLLQCVTIIRMITPWLALMFILILTIVIPQLRIKKIKHAILMQAKPGRQVTTIHGLTGIILATSQNFIIAELEDGRKIEIALNSIVHIDYENTDSH